MTKLRDLKETLALLTSNRYFELFMIGIVIFSAMLIGINTFHVDPFYKELIFTLDKLITIIFLVEISLRILSYEKPLEFFKSGWNIFDFVIVFFSLIPIDGNDSIVARLLRIFRILRIITIMPELKDILNALFRSAASIGHVLILVFIIFYIYAVIGTIFFEHASSGNWNDLGAAFLSLFQIMTLEGWTDILDETMKISSYSWIFYVTFIFLTTYIFLNMIIGIILETLHEEHKKDELQVIECEKALLREMIKQNEILIKKIEKIEEKMLT